MYSTKDIAVVILNWNGKALLEQFLPSVVALSTGAKIYVADNASTDDSVGFISEHFPNVKIIQNTVNGGYAKGYNDVLEHVNESLFCLLNSDIQVTENWLGPIIDTFNNSEKTTIVQPKILDYKNKDYFEYAGAGGGFVDALGYPFCRGRIFDSIERDNGQYNDETSIFWASGACFFIKTERLKHLGGFDESYFAHMEEIDLCWRAFNQGLNVIYNGASTVYHVGGATLSEVSPKKTFLNFRNSLFTLVKNASGWVFFKVLFRLILDGLAGLRFLLQGKFSHFLAILKAHFSFYGHLFELIRKRRQLNQRSGYAQRISIVWDYFVKQKTEF
ncbi:glycosyltransferase family 2 protein [Winogradskyella maritima]|uniref:Glycosyltransferase family 2 protein n=1 Tax=Winogradskyella maritima TaxID=1517766 RepID=A0ABV8ALE6_9FLAO|nr:glycosyltransferase family 2 protein [Winogradskyella maritima]